MLEEKFNGHEFLGIEKAPTKEITSFHLFPLLYIFLVAKKACKVWATTSRNCNTNHTERKSSGKWGDCHKRKTKEVKCPIFRPDWLWKKTRATSPKDLTGERSRESECQISVDPKEQRTHLVPSTKGKLSHLWENKPWNRCCFIRFIHYSVKD